MAKGGFSNGETLGARAETDNGADFGGGVGMCGNDEEARQKVGWKAVGGDEVGGTADGAAAAIGGEDDDGGDGGLEGAVKVGEAFDVEHMDLEKLVDD